MKKYNNLFIGSLIIVATVYYATELYKNAIDILARKAAGESEHEKYKK